MNIFRKALIFPFLVLIILLFSGFERADAKPRFLESPHIHVNPNKSVPLAAIVSFIANEPVKTSIVLSDGEHKWSLHYDQNQTPKEGLTLVGLRPNREHSIQISIEDAEGNVTKSDKVLTYNTPTLPADPAAFPKIKITQSNPEKMEPGYTLLNPRRRLPRQTQQGNPDEQRFGENFGMLLIVDKEGIPIWYYRCGSRISDFEYLDNGHFLYVTADYRIAEIDWLGNIVNEWYAAKRPQGDGDGVAVPCMTFHHDADKLDEDRLLALSTDRRQIDNYYTSEYDADAPRQTQWVMGDRIVEFDADGKMLWTWNAFQHMNPYRIGYETFSNYWMRRGYPDTIDWSHANSVMESEDGKSVYINFRYQSAVVKISKKSSEIIWIFGEPSGWPERFQNKLICLEDESRWFWHQHSPVWTTNGTLLLFDNGNYRARPFEEPAQVTDTYSRAVEYKIDEKNKSARLVWSSEISGDEKVVTVAMGGVSEMPQTGNILVGYGAILDPEGLDAIDWKSRTQIGQWTRVREYTHTVPPEVVWELQLLKTGENRQINWNIFGTQRIKELGHNGE